MIVTHTEKFKTLKSAYSHAKKMLVAPILEFVSLGKAGNGCVLCQEETKYGIEGSIEERLCSFCILKIHTSRPLLCLSIRPPVEYVGMQQFLERMCGISGSSCTGLERGIDKVSTTDEVQSVYDSLRECDECRVPVLEGQLLTNMRQKIRQDAMNAAIRNQIRFKIKIFEEQLECLKDNYVTALGSGNFEDSAEMKSVFFRIFESKIDLEERLSRY